MAKEASECSFEIQKLVQEISSEMGLEQMIKFKTLNVTNAKKVVEIKMSNIITKALTDKEVFVLVYEDAFDLVGDDVKYMWLRVALNAVSYDSEKEKINIESDNVKNLIEMYRKYGKTVIDNVELANLTIVQIQEQEKARKAEEKANKKSKKKKF